MAMRCIAGARCGALPEHGAVRCRSAMGAERDAVRCRAQRVSACCCTRSVRVALPQSVYVGPFGILLRSSLHECFFVACILYMTSPCARAARVREVCV